MKIKYSSNKSSRWSCEPGRMLCYDGKPLVYLSLLDTSLLPPADADDLAEYITFLLNDCNATPERGSVTIIKP